MKGSDGQDMDIFVGAHPTSPHIFVLNQHDPATGQYDEHKVLAGFTDPISAMHAYVNSFTDKAAGRIGGMVAMTPEQFKVWLDTADKIKPVEHESGKDVSAESGEVEVTAEHTRAVEAALGSDADRVAQVDIRRAAELMAEHPDMDVAAAFGHAVIENAVRQKFLTALEASNAYGKEVEGILGTEREAASSMREVPKGKIEDFGEKIGGAKDTAVSTGERAGAPPAAVAAKAAPAEPLSLLQFLASKGGIAPHPELNALDLNGSHRVQLPGRKGFFGVVRPSGQPLDRMREAAQEAGYLRGDGEKTSTIRDFLDAIDNELRGQRQAAEGEELAQGKREKELAAERARHEQERDEADYGEARRNIADAGYTDLPADLYNAAARLVADEGMDPDSAVERAAERSIALGLAKQGTEKLLPPEQRAPIEGAVRDLMKRLLGEHVKVHFQNGLIGLGEPAKARWGDLGENAKAKGMYYPYRHIIRLALTDGIDETAFHEAYHASEYQLQTPQERALMERETPAIAKWIQKKRGYSDSEIEGMAPEEIRAVGAEEYMKERIEGVENPGAGIHVSVRRWWQRLWEALRALANKLRGMGFRTYNDIYGDLYEGKHADRAGDTPRRESDRRAPEVFEEDLGPADDALASIFNKRTAANNRVSNKIANLFSDSRRADMHEVLEDYSYREKLLQKEIEARYLGLTPEEAAKIFPEASKLPDAMQFYIKKGLISGKIVDDSTKFKKQYLDPLVKAANEARISREDIGDYLLAKGAQERNRNISKLYKPGHPFNDAMRDDTIAGGSSFSNKEARDKIKEYESGPKSEAFKDIWKRTRDIVNFNREMMVHFGLETRDTIEDWKRNGKDYIPYAGFEETPEENPEEYFGNSKYSALGIQGPETKRAFGRKSKADNPLVHLIDQTYRTIERGERNMHYNSIWDAFAALEKNGVNVKDIVSANKGTPQKTVDARTGLVKMTDGGRGAQEKGAVNFKRNGIPRTMLFKSEKLAQSILRSSPWTFWGLRHMLLGVNKLKSMWTHYSPDFAARHFLGRYMMEGVLNAQQLKDTGKFSSAKWIADAMPQIGRASRAIAKRNKGIDAGQLGKYWDEMKSQGGQMAFRQMRDINNIKNELTRDLRDLTGKTQLNPLQILHRVTGKVDEIFNTWDNATRLATYAQARDQGMTPQASAHRSLNATVNYQKAGLVANVAGTLLPFFKVSVNTGMRMAGAMNQSARMRNVFLGVFGAGVALALNNYLLGGSDKDGVPFFEKVPPWERALGMVFLNPLERDEQGRPEKYVLPSPFNYALPTSIGYHLTGMLLSELGAIKSSIPTSEHLVDMIKSGLMAFSPFGETGNLTDLITPELIKPLVHVANNKTWTGASVHNDSQFQKGPASENGRDSTGEGWKWAAKGLNSLTGGTPYSSGFLDAYPESIRELADQLFGSQKRFGMEVGSTAGSLYRGEAPKPTETPIARVFRGIDYDQADSVAYSKARREAREEKGAIDKARKDIRSGVNVDEARQFIQDHREAVTESSIFDRAAKQMSRLRQQQERINRSSATDDEKKAALDDVRGRMIDVQNRARAASKRLKEGSSAEPSANVPPPSTINRRGWHQHPDT